MYKHTHTKNQTNSAHLCMNRFVSTSVPVTATHFLKRFIQHFILFLSFLGCLSSAANTNCSKSRKTRLGARSKQKNRKCRT